MKPKQKKFQKLKHKYRLVILNDDTFEEKLSFRLSRLNVFAVAGLSSILLIILVTLLIAFTSLREFIPGYANVTIRKVGLHNALRVDSLEIALSQKQLYIDNIKNIIQGNPISFNQEVRIDSSIDYKSITNQPIKEDSLLRNMVETEEKYTLFKSAAKTPSTISSFIFFSPIKGTITQKFNIKGTEKHRGIDIVAPKNEVIKSTLNGTVIFAEFTNESGYVIQIQHESNLLSVYKHNSVLYKKVGDRVNAGEVIAIIGNTGEFSSGPHLHFELWYNGIPLNPEEYISF